MDSKRFNEIHFGTDNEIKSFVLRFECSDFSSDNTRARWAGSNLGQERLCFWAKAIEARDDVLDKWFPLVPSNLAWSLATIQCKICQSQSSHSCKLTSQTIWSSVYFMRPSNTCQIFDALLAKWHSFVNLASAALVCRARYITHKEQDSYNL